LTLWPQSLFGRTAATLALTMLVFLAVATSAAVYFVMVPMAKRSAHDFAAELVSAAHSLQVLPEAELPRFKQLLLRDHGLIVADQEVGAMETTNDDPYFRFFRESLARLAGRELSIIEADSGPLLWVDMPINGKTYRLGFDRGRLGVNPPLALVLTVAAGALLILFASLLEVRRVTRPLERFSASVDALGRGRHPAPLPEDGPQEIAMLARAFNRLSGDLKQMAENRTVMISGISHDLRTPLTRLAIAAEMLDENTNPAIVRGIRRDLDVMNSLIGQFLHFSRDAAEACPVQMDPAPPDGSAVRFLRRPRGAGTHIVKPAEECSAVWQRRAGRRHAALQPGARGHRGRRPRPGDSCGPGRGGVPSVPPTGSLPQRRLGRQRPRPRDCPPAGTQA
jgi:two-component system osmolarity sensor histidine kinase EnvZ